MGICSDDSLNVLKFSSATQSNRPKYLVKEDAKQRKVAGVQLQISGGSGCRRADRTQVCYSPVLRQGPSDWGQGGAGLERQMGKISWKKEEKWKLEVYLGEGKAGLRWDVALPGLGRKGSLGYEGLSTWRPHCAVCCREEEAEM